MTLLIFTLRGVNDIAMLIQRCQLSFSFTYIISTKLKLYTKK